MAEIDIRDLHQPLRDELRRLDLLGLLALLWRVSGPPLGRVVATVSDSRGKAREIYLWEVHLIAREAVLYTVIDTGLKQADGDDLIKLINHLRRISEEISKRTVTSGEDALRSMHLVIHQQARWQKAREWDRFLRAYRIYGRDGVRSLLEGAVGVRLSSIYTLTLAIAGAAARSPATLSNNDYTFLGISESERGAYFAMVGAPLDSIREKLIKRQRFDESWAFTWSPLEGAPLIQLWAERPDHYLCPFPYMLLRRATDSLFFDLIRSDAKFENPYGMAFQGYVGDVLRAQFVGPWYRVLEEQTYWVKKDLKHGVDWIVSDSSGHIMLECKTRRLRVDAKAISEGDVLTAAINELATIVVQHYKNINDALQGFTHWKSDGNPIYPIVMTLEDWNLFAPHVTALLHSVVYERLAKADLAGLVEKWPFIVTSVEDFERAGQAIAQIGIQKFCSSRVASENRHFGLSMHASDAFPEVDVKYKQIFENGGEEMFGYLSPVMDLPGPEYR